MASRTTLTILFGFAAVFWCLEPFEATAKMHTSNRGFARLVAAALLPAVLIPFALTLLLLFAHVRALGRANAAGGCFSGRLVKVTLAATVAALLSGALLRLVAAGVLGGADDVGWPLNTK